MPLVVETKTEKQLLSRDEARTFLGIGGTMLWKLTVEGRLASVRIGRRVLYRVTDLERFIARRRSVAR